MHVSAPNPAVATISPFDAYSEVDATALKRLAPAPKNNINIDISIDNID